MSDKLRYDALKKCLIKMRTGSHLYGTNTPTSDEDFIGVFVPPVEYILGLKTVEEIDFSIYSKDVSGKNNPDAIDFKMYELRKFARLALQNNPNIVELLFCNEENIIETSDEWKLLQENKSLFLHKGLKERFIGYAISQRHKMVIKGTNYKDLLEAYKELECRPDKSVMAEVYNDFPKAEIDGIEKILFTKNEAGCHIHVGDICFEPGVYVKKARDKIKERLDKAGNRTELLLKHGYDCYSEDTEFLTTSGWKKYFDISNDEMLATINPYTFKLEFQTPYDKVCKQYNGQMYEYIGVNTKFCVTLNHRMFLSPTHRSKKNNFSIKYEKQNSNWSFVSLENIFKSNRSNFHCLTCPSINEEDNVFIEDDYINIIGLFCSEGCWGKFNKKGPRCIKICQTNHGKQIVFEIMDNISVDFGFKKYTYYRKDKQLFETSWVSHNKILIDRLKKDCGIDKSKEKKLPNWIISLSKRQADILLNALIAGDGSKKNDFASTYYTASKDLANGVQILSLVAGRDSNVCGPYEYKSSFDSKKMSISYQTIVYNELSSPKCLRISPHMTKNIRHNKKEDNRGGRLKDYTGNVVCFSVPNELLITRLDGKIAIQGNTKFASHLIRLMKEGIELLETGDLKFPLTYKDTLLEIRSGKWEMRKVLDESEKLEERMIESFNKTSLPAHPKEKVIEDIVIEILRKNLN